MLIHKADLRAGIDAEAIYEDVVGGIYEDAVNQGETTASARTSATSSDSGGSLEAFGTGIQDQEESTEREIEAARRSEQLRARSSDDADDFGAGTQGEGATDRQIQAARDRLDEDDTPPEVFGTGFRATTARTSIESERRTSRKCLRLSRGRWPTRKTRTNAERPHEPPDSRERDERPREIRVLGLAHMPATKRQILTPFMYVTRTHKTVREQRAVYPWGSRGEQRDGPPGPGGA